MASNSAPILWLPEKFVGAMPVVKAVEPVMVWDNDARRMTDKQVTSDDILVWRVTVLIGTGWGGDLTPVEVRIKSAHKPDIALDPARVVAFLGLGSASAKSGGA